MRSVWGFVCAVAGHWGSLVTGGVIIGFITIWQGTGHSVPPSVYWAIALCALFVACFQAWNQERQTKENALRAQPTQRDWAGDWKQLASNFKAEVRHGVGAGYEKHATLGESWHLMGNLDAVQRLEALCKHAGNLLSASPKIAGALSAELLQHPPMYRWLFNLKGKTTAFQSNGYGFETLESGEKAHILSGSIRNVAELSANICMEYASEEY